MIQIDDETKMFLLKVAKDAIWSKLAGEELPEYYSRNKKFYEEGLGIVLKLKIDGKLRGYTGILTSPLNIIKTVQEIAINSAFNDPRFVPVQKEEFDKLKIEIFVIKEILELKNINTLNPQNNGLFIKSDSIEGVVFPDDFENLQITPEIYINLAKLKMGIDEKVKNIQYFVLSFEKIVE